MWLKNDFFVKRIPTARVDAVNEIDRQLSLHPVGFDNEQVNDAYRKLTVAIETFEHRIVNCTAYENENQNRTNRAVEVEGRR